MIKWALVVSLILNLALGVVILWIYLESLGNW
jgi:hypothetical protein